MEDREWIRTHSPLSIFYFPSSILRPRFVFSLFQLHPRSKIAFIKSEPINSRPGTLPPAPVNETVM